MLTADTVDRIVQFDGRALPVTSIYTSIDPDPGLREDLLSRVSSLLDQVRPLAKDGTADHEARLSVRADLDRIRDALAEKRWRPGGMAIFACSGRDLYEEIALPRPVRDRIMVDSTPYVRPMLTVLNELHRTCVVVVDKVAACFWEVYQDEMRELTRIRGQALRKPNFAAGQAEYGVRNKADELRKRHYRAVVQELEDLFRAGTLDLLIIGGHDHEVPAFTEFLPPDLRARIAGTFCMDPGTAPLAEIRKNADLILDRYDRDQEHQLVSDILERLAAGGLATAGLDGCLWAASVAAAQTLVMLDGAQTPGVVCDESRWLALTGQTCPLCGKPTRHTPDVLDDLAELVMDEGGSIRHVEDDDRLQEHTVAAALRFQLPPVPVPG
jgi:peptide chain release factor subunit 1